MAVSILPGDTLTPKRQVDLGHNGFPRWEFPPVERPKVNATCGFQIDRPKPRNIAVGRFRHLSLHVKMED